MNKFEKKIVKAAKYIRDGHPYKDVIDEDDVMAAIEELAAWIEWQYEDKP